ncbi:MAG TPA: hypothetical protein VFT64_00940 [Rickettsiales bacterium]|nr:hypothetical protein [Rickettsiales bacterium]
MTKRNKLRYKSQGNTFPTITMTGTVLLRMFDDEGQEVAGDYVKGDLQIFLSTDSQVIPEARGDYQSIGLEGYLKANVFDGKGWKPLSLEEFFPGREHYFSKRERPIDTYHMCLPILEATQGTVLARTYREHYRIATPGDIGNH